MGSFEQAMEQIRKISILSSLFSYVALKQQEAASLKGHCQLSIQLHQKNQVKTRQLV